MTKRIEEVLNLMPIAEESESLSVPEIFDDPDDVFDLSSHDKEMNEIYDTAIQAHKDMMELSFNMEPKNAGSVLDPATKILELAMKASQSKIDARVKVAKSIMERDKVNFETKKTVEEGQIEGEVDNVKGYVANRNDVLKRLREKANASSDGNS